MIRDMSVLFLAAQEKSNYFSCYLLRTTLMLESCDMRHIQQDLARLSISNESVAQCSPMSMMFAHIRSIITLTVCFIMKMIHLLVLIRCRRNAAPVLKFLIECRISPCHCLELFVNSSSFLA